MRLMEICAAVTALSMSPLPAHAHGDGLAADGCHNDRKNGGRHCNRAPARSASLADRPQRLSGGRTYYANCTSRAQRGRCLFAAVILVMRYT